MSPIREWLQPLHANIRLVWKGLTVQNTLASYDMAKTTAVKTLTNALTYETMAQIDA